MDTRAEAPMIKGTYNNKERAGGRARRRGSAVVTSSDSPN